MAIYNVITTVQEDMILPPYEYARRQGNWEAWNAASPGNRRTFCADPRREQNTVVWCIEERNDKLLSDYKKRRGYFMSSGVLYMLIPRLILDSIDSHGSRGLPIFAENLEYGINRILGPSSRTQLHSLTTNVNPSIPGLIIQASFGRGFPK